MKHSIGIARAWGRFLGQRLTRGSQPHGHRAADVAEDVAAVVTLEYQQGLGSPSEQSATGPGRDLYCRSRSGGTGLGTGRSA